MNDPATRRPICSRSGCTEPGRYQPVLLAWAAGADRRSHPPARIQFGLVLCKAHRRGCQVADLVDDLGWDTICGQFVRIGKALPDRSTLALEFLDLDARARRKSR